jgi:hypothetical protein
MLVVVRFFRCTVVNRSSSNNPAPSQISVITRPLHRHRRLPSSPEPHASSLRSRPRLGLVHVHQSALMDILLHLSCNCTGHIVQSSEPLAPSGVSICERCRGSSHQRQCLRSHFRKTRHVQVVRSLARSPVRCCRYLLVVVHNRPRRLLSRPSMTGSARCRRASLTFGNSQFLRTHGLPN